MFDVIRSFYYVIKTEHMMVDGRKFGDTSQTCYIPIFYHGLDQNDKVKKTVFVGNTFMQDYYVVYDMSQYESKKYLQVGIAPQASYNIGLAKQYDRGSGYYGPGTSKVWDQSVIEAGKCD